jgi:PEGA domain-containing protein
VKRQLPLIIGFLVGVFALLEFYIPAHPVHEVMKFLLDTGTVLAAAAFVLGGINVIQVNLPIIRRRRQDWPYKVVLIGCAAVTLGAGLSWNGCAGRPEPGQVSYDPARGEEAGGAARPSLVKVTANRGDAEVSFDDHPFEPLGSAAAASRPMDPGPHTVAVRAAQRGYTDYRASIQLAAGQVVTVRAQLRMVWGVQGRVYTWLYDHLFAPCNATMFALLAFFIASAAFRAFRARNLESALLLGSAILIMIGLVPLGRALSPYFPAVAEWIVQIPNNAGRRAIMIGAALGAIATSLRVLVGIERSHLGRD